ncbi:MAG: hypothetical protein ACR2G3_10525 [Solirubrobacterales bacterium]
MGIRARISRLAGGLGRSPHSDGAAELHVGDPRFDSWDVVEDLEELYAARALRQHLQELGQECVLTADWPLDRFGRGDIALRVPPGEWSQAEALLSHD